MLKEWLGSLLATPVDLVFCAGETLHFRCAKTLAPGKAHSVRARLPEGQLFGARVQVTASPEGPQGLYVGSLLEPLDAVPHLRSLLPLPFEDRRSTPRLERTIRVLSPQVEGYSALTRDVSSEGLCLTISQIFPAGTLLQMEMDLDNSSPEPLRVELEVRWAAPDLRSGKNLIGGRFRSISPRLRHNLKTYLDQHRS